ncbi:MAG: primosomal protein N' [Oscillospiraceae bacterium]|nr:primosomal protein N' [Oscillospiraceae bacterium]
MYAEVIVNHISRAVDRVFDYAVPEELTESIRPGSRVIVPFSKGNKEIEGFVLRTKSNTEASVQIKNIIRFASDEPAFLAEDVPLIEFMRTRYLASYQEIIHTMMPTGTAVKTLEWIVISDEEYKPRSGSNDERVMELLKDNGGGMDIYSLGSYFEKDIRSLISRMEKKGVLKKEYRHMRDINKRKIRAVRLIADTDTVNEFFTKSRSGIQKRMLSILKSNDFLSAADLVRFSMGNYGALAALVKNGMAEYFDLYIDRPAYESAGEITAPPLPTSEQAGAIYEICSGIDDKTGETMLLHGVTGSGKTEVFLQAIAHSVKLGRTALMLVPEISLTPQMVSRFVSRFGDRIAIFHSGLSLGERYDQWTRIMNGDADIVIGARSAVFAPLKNIGIIIIDEEHSETYKSEISPRYHARETAIFRAKQNGAVTILASATPSLESYKNALDKKYKLIEMKERYNRGKMPDIDIVDMRVELENGNKSMFSKTLRNAIEHNLENGEQSILFMNRRGFSTFVSCRKCGFVPMCPNCNITLTYHSYDDSLKCHYCGHKQCNYTKCPACGSKYIRYFGGGTQRVEDEVHRLFPNASTIRLDADVTIRKNSHKEILDRFANEKIDILVGTQMVSKGLDFANVTLVGVMSADTMLHINDFRSGERTFDTLEQVSGRAGRGEKPGRAVIQTYDPENLAVKLVKTHDYKSFYLETIAERRAMWYPPYSEMVCIRLTDTDNDKTRRAAFLFKESFGDIHEITQKAAILGPIPSGVSRIKNRYRWQIILKCENADLLNDRLIRAAEAVAKNKDFENTTVSIDKNPITIY